MSTITISGNLAADPELRYTPERQGRGPTEGEREPAVQGRGGMAGREPNVYRIQVWEGQAENIAESCTKGDRVLVTGAMATERWTDKDSQEPRTSQYIKAKEVGFSLRFHIVRATKNSGGPRANTSPSPGRTCHDRGRPVERPPLTRRLRGRGS